MTTLCAALLLAFQEGNGDASPALLLSGAMKSAVNLAPLGADAVPFERGDGRTQVAGRRPVNALGRKRAVILTRVDPGGCETGIDILGPPRAQSRHGIGSVRDS
nr:hypothetical protein [Azospirillum griseum]